jgi:hypothetical protein
MKTTWLLWLWALRMCSAFQQRLNCASKWTLRDDWGVVCHNNNLSTLHPNHYPLNVKILTYLDLDNNGITELDENVFRNVTRLETLILSNNMLETLAHRLFWGLYELKILDLSNNRLTSIRDKLLFKCQGNLRKLLLSHNKISVIRAEVLAPFRHLQVLTLSDNSFVCDCKLRLVMKWCDLRKLDTKAKCIKPFLYSGLSWTVLRSTESCKDLQILEASNKSEAKNSSEMRDNGIRVTLLIAGISLSLILIWCSVIGLYLWQKLAHHCRKQKESDIYDEIKPSEYYYYE